MNDWKQLVGPNEFEHHPGRCGFYVHRDGSFLPVPANESHDRYAFRNFHKTYREMLVDHFAARCTDDDLWYIYASDIRRFRSAIQKWVNKVLEVWPEDANKKVSVSDCSGWNTCKVIDLASGHLPEFIAHAR
jgi:hypothetical protein